MDAPQSAVVAILKEHAKYQKQFKKRHTPEYLKYKLVNLENVITTVTILLCRSKLKQKATHCHEREKEYMATLQAVWITTSSYSADTALEEDNTDMFEFDVADNSITLVDSPLTLPLRVVNHYCFCMIVRPQEEVI